MTESPQTSPADGRIRNTALAAALLAVLASACQEPPPPAEPVIRPVRCQRIFVSGGQRVRQFSGTAQAGVESKLSFKVQGTIRRLPVRVGDRVEPGRLIAELDPADYELRVQEAEAALLQANAQARNAEANYDRVRALYENNNASRNELDAARAAAESAGGQVRSVEKRLELARLQVDYTRLTASVRGDIAEVMVEENENVRPGQTIVRVTSGAVPEVQVTIPESLITQIRKDDPVEVLFDAIQGRRFAGRVLEVGVASTGTGTTFPVTVALDASDPRALPGMAAEVAFTFGSTARERFWLPPEAVSEDRQGRFVFVLRPLDGDFAQVQRRVVEVGELTSLGLEVVSGIADGEMVVTAGLSQIQDGQRVRLPEGGGC